jgi:hypothetical protein
MREQCSGTEIVTNVIGATQSAIRKPYHHPDWHISSSSKTGTNSERFMVNHRKWLIILQTLNL